MNIPPKYEDVVAQIETERARVTDYIAQRAQTELKLEAALGRETALREELETEKRANYNARVALKAASETCELWKGRTTNLTHANAALQQRLTVAEQWAGELEAAAQEMLRVAGIANQGSRAYTRAIINLNAALKPVAEVKS